MLVRCALSNPDAPHDVDTDIAFRKVSGWERRRTGGGLNALALRQSHDEYACYACIERLQKGISVSQTTLL